MSFRTGAATAVDSPTVPAMDRTPARTSADARRLGAALEPIIGQVYFSPECHAAYQDLGFDPSHGDMGGVALPDGVAYFTSRGSLLGQAPGEVVAAAFGVFDPEVVIPCVARGWELTDAVTIRGARDAGALAQLERLLGTPDELDRVGATLAAAADAVSVEGRPLAAGVQAQDVPDHPWGAVFRAGDLLREYRGDSHTLTWVGAGLDAIQIGLLTELYWGLPLRSYSRTRGWSDEKYDRAEAALEDRGLIADGGFTTDGRELREEIEVATDGHMGQVLDALGDDLDTVLTPLERWGRLVRDGKGYPASGPHDLAAAGSR